jgi:hypothetical protein
MMFSRQLCFLQPARLKRLGRHENNGGIFNKLHAPAVCFGSFMRTNTGADRVPQKLHARQNVRVCLNFPRRNLTVKLPRSLCMI